MAAKRTTITIQSQAFGRLQRQSSARAMFDNKLPQIPVELANF
jgi:urease accessory protein UreH